MNVSTRSVERCLSIAASREDVYQALLDPASLSRWMYATVRIKPQKGGAYRIDWQDTALPASAQGEILEMEEGRRLVLSLEAPGALVAGTLFNVQCFGLRPED